MTLNSPHISDNDIAAVSEEMAEVESRSGETWAILDEQSDQGANEEHLGVVERLQASNVPVEKAESWLLALHEETLTDEMCDEICDMKVVPITRLGLLLYLETTNTKDTRVLKLMAEVRQSLYASSLNKVRIQETDARNASGIDSLDPFS